MYSQILDPTRSERRSEPPCVAVFVPPDRKNRGLWWLLISREEHWAPDTLPVAGRVFTSISGALEALGLAGGTGGVDCREGTVSSP